MCVWRGIFGGMQRNSDTMKKITITFITLAFFAHNAHSQTSTFDADKTAIRHFLIQHCVFKESNPTHREGAEYVNAFVRKVFERHYTDDEIPELINRALRLFWAHSVGEIEDSPDFLRIITRRSMILMSLAFLSGELDLPSWFLDDARSSLNRLHYDLNARMMLIVNMIELFELLRRGGGLTHHHVARFQNELEKRAPYITDNVFIAEYSEILWNIASRVRERRR